MHSATTVFFRLLLLRYFCAIFFFALSSSCAGYKIPTTELVDGNDLEHQSACHALYRVIPRSRAQLYPYDLGHHLTWTFFGNEDDGIFGEGPMARFNPEQPPSLKKAVCWWCRNPLHNFCHYVIGSADRVNSEIDILQIVDNKISGLHYRSEGYKVFAGEGTCFYFALHGGKPFVSLRLCYHPKYRADIYIGWRERGNFGIKFAPFCRCL